MGMFCVFIVFKRGEWRFQESAADVMGESETTGCWFGPEADHRHMLSQTPRASAVALTTRLNRL